MPRDKLEKSFKYPENLFPLTGIAGVSEKKKRKNFFNKPKKQIPLTKIRLLFKKRISQFPLAAKKKSLNKRIMFQLNRKLVSTGGNGETFKKTFLLERKTTSIDKNI